MAHLALVISSGNGDDPIWAKAMIRMIPERLFTYDGANA